MKNNINNYKPIKEYNNAFIQKNSIKFENNNKIGVYCITNILNSQKYVGCSKTNLGKRLSNYYQISYLNRKSGLIYPAIKKLGISFFKIEILEYCKKNNVLEREKYYINSIKPEYNIRGKN
jgi:group I intron endonuclease